MNRAWVQTSVLTALAVALNVSERYVVGPLPFVRLGLANAMTVVVLIAYGPWHALTLAVGRVVVASLLTGMFMGPTFVIGLAGAVGAWATMSGVWWLGRWLLGPLGISVIGAVAHNVCQVAMASLVVLGSWELASLWPLIALVSAGAGTATGLVALGLGRALFGDGGEVGREIEKRQTEIENEDRGGAPPA